jgi:hypothetical protein
MKREEMDQSRRVRLRLTAASTRKASADIYRKSIRGAMGQSRESNKRRWCSFNLGRENTTKTEILNLSIYLLHLISC